MRPVLPAVPLAELLRLERERLAAPAPAAAAVPLPEDPGEPELSMLARLVSQLSGGQAPAPEAPCAGQAPLPERIKQMIQRSGMFYESHLRAWVAGEFPLAELESEPQAKLGPRAARGPYSVPAVLEPLVREQLAAIATGEAALAFNPWPGDPVRLVISEDLPPRLRGQDADAAPAWRARLKLELPRLGALELAISVRGDAVRIEARAGERAAEELRHFGDAIRGALAARALRLEFMEANLDVR